MGQVCWSVSSFAQPTVVRWCCALSPCGWASNLCLRLLFAPCHYGCITWDESLRLSLALSSVLPCPMLWFHVRLHDTCSRSWGCPWCLTLDPSRWGWSLCRRLLLAPCSCRAHSFLVVLAVAACLRELVDLSIVLP